MKLKHFLKQLFCRHNYKLEFIDRKGNYLFGFPNFEHYKCEKCGKTKITEKY